MVGPPRSEAEARFSSLRKRLDEGGYLESFGFDSFRLVEHLYQDLKETTESLQKTLAEYAQYKKIAEELEDGVAPFKEENVRLYRENSQLRMNIARVLEETEEKAQDPLARVRDLEAENSDLKLLVSQFAERVKNAEVDSLEKSRRLVKLQEKDLGLGVIVGERGKKAMSQSKQAMEVDYFVGDACPQCIRLRNYVEYGEGSDRNPKTIDYVKLADSRIEALQLQLRSFKNLEKEHMALIASLKSRVGTRDAEIEKLRDLIKVRPGRDNKANAMSPSRNSEIYRNLEAELKSAELQLQMMQRRNIELEEKLKKSILQEHEDYMLGKIPSHFENRNLAKLCFEKELDKVPSHDKMSLLEKLYYLERQLSHCCREKAVLQNQIEECRMKHLSKSESESHLKRESAMRKDSTRTGVGESRSPQRVSLRSDSSLRKVVSQGHGKVAHFNPRSSKVVIGSKAVKTVPSRSLTLPSSKQTSSQKLSDVTEEGDAVSEEYSSEAEVNMENEEYMEQYDDGVGTEEDGESGESYEINGNNVAPSRTFSSQQKPHHKSSITQGTRPRRTRPEAGDERLNKHVTLKSRAGTRDTAQQKLRPHVPPSSKVRKGVVDESPATYVDIDEYVSEGDENGNGEPNFSSYCDDNANSKEETRPKPTAAFPSKPKTDKKTVYTKQNGSNLVDRRKQKANSGESAARSNNARNQVSMKQGPVQRAHRAPSGPSKLPANLQQGRAARADPARAKQVTSDGRGLGASVKKSKMLENERKRTVELRNIKEDQEVGEESEGYGEDDAAFDLLENYDEEEEENEEWTHQHQDQYAKPKDQGVISKQRSETQIGRPGAMNSKQVAGKGKADFKSQDNTRGKSQVPSVSKSGGPLHSQSTKGQTGLQQKGESQIAPAANFAQAGARLENDSDGFEQTGYYDEEDAPFDTEDRYGTVGGQPISRVDGAEYAEDFDRRAPNQQKCGNGKRIGQLQGSSKGQENVINRELSRRGFEEEQQGTDQVNIHNPGRGGKSIRGNFTEDQQRRAGDSMSKASDAGSNLSRPYENDRVKGITNVEEPSLLSMSEFDISEVESSTGVSKIRPRGREDGGYGYDNRQSEKGTGKEFGRPAYHGGGAQNIGSSSGLGGKDASTRPYMNPSGQPQMTKGLESIGEREYSRGGGDATASIGEISMSEASFTRRTGDTEGKGYGVPKHGMVQSSFDERDEVARGHNPTQGLTAFSRAKPRNGGNGKATYRSIGINTEGGLAPTYPGVDGRDDAHEKRSLLDKIAALQRKLDDVHQESSRHQLKSFELQGELERTKHMLQVEKQDRELAHSELKRLREMNNESTARLLMNSAMGSDGSFRRGATPMEMEREIMNLRAAMSSLDRDKDEMRVELDRKDEKLARFINEGQRYMDEISQLNLRLKNAELQISHTGESAKEQTREVEFIKKQLESTRRDLDRTIRERDEALKELHKLSGAHSKGQMERRSVETELELKSKEADDLRRQVQRYIDEVRRIEELLLDKEEELETLLQHYRSLTAENNNLEAQRTSLEREAFSIRESVKDAVDQNITFKTQLASQNALVQSLEEEIQRFTQQIAHLENQLESKTEKEKMLEADVKASKDLIYRLEVQMDKLKLDVADCESKRKQLEAENQELTAHITSMESRLQDETERQAQLETLIANSREKDFQLERTTLDISRERDELSEKLTALQHRSETLNSEVSRYRLKSIELQSELDRTRRQLDSEKRERDTTVSELRKLREQLHSSSANKLLNAALGATGSSSGSRVDTSPLQMSSAGSTFRQTLMADIPDLRGSREQSPVATGAGALGHSMDRSRETPLAASTSRVTDEQLGPLSTPRGAQVKQPGEDEFEAWDSPVNK